MDVIDAFWEVDFGRSVHWRIPFMALDDTPYQINIYEEGYQGSVVVLKGGAQPFITQETEDEDAFLPLRTSSGYITIVCEDAALVDAILPNEVHDRYVELVDVTPNANKVVWNGYILPEEFSNDWNTTPFELQLPVASPIAAEEYPLQSAEGCTYLYNVGQVPESDLFHADGHVLRHSVCRTHSGFSVPCFRNWSEYRVR